MAHGERDVGFSNALAFSQWSDICRVRSPEIVTRSVGPLAIERVAKPGSAMYMFW